MREKRDGLARKIETAFRDHLTETMLCFRKRKQVMPFPKHFQFANGKESCRKAGNFIVSIILHIKNKKQVSLLLQSAAFYFLLAHFFEVLAEEETIRKGTARSTPVRRGRAKTKKAKKSKKPKKPKKPKTDEQIKKTKKRKETPTKKRKNQPSKRQAPARKARAPSKRKDNDRRK